MTSILEHYSNRPDVTLAVEAVAVAMYSHQTGTRSAHWNPPLPSSKKGTGPKHACL